MNHFFNYFKNNLSKIMTGFVFTSAFVCIIYIVGSTYANNGYKIVFNRAEGTEVMKTCYTLDNGKLDEDCLNAISKVCSKWSLDKYTGSNVQGNQSSISNLRELTFESDKEYYCVARTSQKGYDKGCYICNDDNNIKKWKFDTDSDKDCTSGYYKDTSINEENCVTVVPNTCYVCKSDNNIMKWDNTDTADNACSAGYESTDKAESECVTVVPNACYVCKSDNNIMKWDNTDIADNACSAGYTSVNKAESECVPVKNPGTGNVLIFFVIILEILALCYPIHYFKNKITNTR